MKTNLIKKMMAVIIIASLSFMLKSFGCPEGPIPECPFPNHGYTVFFPHFCDCHWFFHCSDGVAYCRQCPAGLHWNTVLDVCDFPDNANCPSGGGCGGASASCTKNIDCPPGQSCRPLAIGNGSSDMTAWCAPPGAKDGPGGWLCIEKVPHETERYCCI